MLRSIFVLTLPVAVAACGASPTLHPVPPAGACSFDDATVSPADGAGPLHRLTPVAVRYRGDAGNVRIDVTADGEAVSGETDVSDGTTLFIPLGVLPANTRIRWTVTACGSTKAGSFTTGKLVHPLEDIDACMGRPWEMDLRRATWQEPVPETPAAALLLKWRFAPSVLLMMSDVDDGGDVDVLLAPATSDAGGNVVRDFTRPAQVIEASLAGNPYVTLDPADFQVGLGEGAVTLRSVELVLGLGDAGVEDGRLTAEVDTRLAGDDACRELATLTGTGCHACDRNDSKASCFLLSMTDVVALPSDADLGGMPGTGPRPLPAPGEDVVPAATAGVPRVPTLPWRVPCPDGLCPPRDPPSLP